jgi:hypothetical protein
VKEFSRLKKIISNALICLLLLQSLTSYAAISGVTVQTPSKPQCQAPSVYIIENLLIWKGQWLLIYCPFLFYFLNECFHGLNLCHITLPV